MSRISFIATPLSPIVNLVPVAIPRNGKGTLQNLSLKKFLSKFPSCGVVEVVLNCLTLDSSVKV